MREKILECIEGDRERIVNFLRTFVRAASPNPPGDTRVAMKEVCALLDSEKVDYKFCNRDETMPNLVASRTYGAGERHLVLNGHIDVFPVENADAWSRGPWDAVL